VMLVKVDRIYSCIESEPRQIIASGAQLFAGSHSL